MRKKLNEIWQDVRPDSVDFVWMMITCLLTVALCSFAFIEILKDAAASFDAQYICVPRT